ncbi:MAG: hypothetical protein HY964_07510 [Ignavibacteriales bacterium]|nr:hypothetical protein [Ignavibacteriales bacterium]
MKVFFITSIYFVSILTLISCKQESPTSEDEKSTKPIVNIISPLQNASVVDSTVIEVEATDDKGITRVEIYIDNILDTSRVIIIKPYRWIWDVQDLQDSSVHIIYAKAFDADGNVSSSSVITVTIFKLTPSNLHVLTINEDEIVLQWQDNSRIETAFVIEKGNDGINFSPVDTVGANINNVAIHGTYLTTNKYYFQVKALSNSKISKYSNIAIASFSFQAPTNLTIASTTENAVQLQWHDNSTIEQGFGIEEQITGNSFNPVDTVGANDTTAIIIGAYLTTNTYNFRVRAIGKANASDYSNIASTTLLFPSPTDLMVLSIAENAVRLQWQDNSSFETSFEIEQSTDGNNFVTAEIVNSNETTATVMGTYLTTNSYIFRARAKTILNTSYYSNRVKIYYAEDLFAGGLFSAVGSKRVKNVALWNGDAWFELDGGLSYEIHSLVSYRGHIYAGGIFGLFERWDGPNWNPIEMGMVMDIHAMISHNDELYVGGRPLSSTSRNSITKWEGNNWYSLNNGMNGVVLSLAILNGDLFAAGNFDTAGNINANCIARWDGVNWNPLGVGINKYRYVYALCPYNNELFVGGEFDIAGGITANGIAKWNGSEWFPVGSGINEGGVIKTLMVYKDELYAGGSFASIDGKNINNIAKWDGSAWSSIGAGLDGTVYCLAIYNDQLYAGGSFSGCIKMWDGTSWITVGAVSVD